ncbi:MAG: HAMP domain-containing histidine kinase [Actinobacteria bacterium]|nr:HAMP domain-containing histidine kinase [Actinomycetota bacterium]
MAPGNETSRSRTGACRGYRGPDRRRAPTPSLGFRAFRPALLLLLLGAAWLAVGLVYDPDAAGATVRLAEARFQVGAAALALVAGGTCVMRSHLEGSAACWWYGWGLLGFGALEMASSAPGVSGIAATVTTFCGVAIATTFTAIGLGSPPVNTRISLAKTITITVVLLTVASAVGVAFVTSGADRASALLATVGTFGLAATALVRDRERPEAKWLVPFLVALGIAALVSVVVAGTLGVIGAGAFTFVALAVAAFGAISSITVTASEHRAEALHADIEREEADGRLHSIEDEYRGRMHELRSSVTALAGGVRGLEQTDAVSAPLAWALETELERLRALVSERKPPGSSTSLSSFVVSTALSPTLEVCSAAGWPVSWELTHRELAYGRPAEVAQIVQGLVANARKHARGSPIEVRTTLDGEHLLVTVEDRGPGVPRNQRELVFEPGVTGDRSAAGTGLGLAIARRLARDMLAELWVEPRAGGGASFVLSLRRVDPERRDARLASSGPRIPQ